MPSVMMNGCTREARSTISPLTSAADQADGQRHRRDRSATVAAVPDGSTARSTIAIVTPAQSAYTEPTDRSILRK